MQVEYPWALGPQPGRYAMREHVGEGVRHVLVLDTLGAAQRRRLVRRARARRAPSHPAPVPVVTSRATLIDTTALCDPHAAEQWLRQADLQAVAAEALARLNRVLHAHRVASADAFVREVSARQALVVRVGYGDGEQVADGRWDRAIALAPPTGDRHRRPTALRDQERLAALLTGRDAVLACEELTLRARADLDAERWREAALQLDVALGAALTELEPWRRQARLDERLDELGQLRESAGAAARAAQQGGLQDAQIAAVRHALGRLEAALRARTAGGIG